MVQAERYAGGLVAFAGAGTEIVNSFAFATLGSALESGLPVYAGGFSGAVEAGAALQNCSATGLVDCTGMAAGFAAQNAGSIRNSLPPLSWPKVGPRRAAFAANNSGEVINCAYDAQMACADDGAAQSLSTAAMTGKSATLAGGSWHTAENAYPQLAFLRRTRTRRWLCAARPAPSPCACRGCGPGRRAGGGRALPLPAAVDGAAVEWRAAGSLEVSAAGDSAPVLRPAEEGQPRRPKRRNADEPGRPGSRRTDGRPVSRPALRAQPRPSPLAAAAVSNAGGYANWYEVGAAVEQGKNGLDQYKFNANGGGTTEDPWLISTPESLAHLGYALSRSELNSYGLPQDLSGCYFKLAADLDLAVRANAARQSLEWWPVGGKVYEAIPNSGRLQGRRSTEALTAQATR